MRGELQLEAHPQLLDVARRNLERWLQQNPATALRDWRRILDSTPLADVVALLRSSSEEATRLRQSSLAGLLTTEERRALVGAYESRRPRAHPPRSRLSAPATSGSRTQLMRQLGVDVYKGRFETAAAQAVVLRVKREIAR